MKAIEFAASDRRPPLQCEARAASSSYPDRWHYVGIDQKEPRVKTAWAARKASGAENTNCKRDAWGDSRAEQRLTNRRGACPPQCLPDRESNRFLPKARDAATTKHVQGCHRHHRQDGFGRFIEPCWPAASQSPRSTRDAQEQTNLVSANKGRGPRRVCPTEFRGAVRRSAITITVALRFGICFCRWSSPCPKSCFSLAGLWCVGQLCCRTRPCALPMKPIMAPFHSRQKVKRDNPTQPTYNERL